MRVLCIFLDGIGIGSNDPKRNPFARFRSSIFPPSLHASHTASYNGRIIPTDACLGIPGLPQSATGQMTIFSGINAPQYFGAHLSGFATLSIIKILKCESIFVKVLKQGKTAAFANAYSHEFFELPDKIRARFTSVTTASTQTAGLPFLLVEDILQGRSLYHDFTNAALRDRGHDVPHFTPEFAGKQLAHLSQEYDFCLYEYFLTDKVGHFGNMERALQEVEKLESFLFAVLEHTDLNSTLVLLCSDHGNMEDMSVMTHTTNPVPTIVWGNIPPETLSSIHSLTDITPFMLMCVQDLVL